MQHRRLRIVVEEEESSEDEFGLPRQLDLEMGSDGDADVEERSEGGEPDTEAAADEEEDRTPPECPQPQQGRRRTSAEFLAAVTIPGGDEEEGRGGDPLIRELRERGLPTSMPFGRYLGTSLRRMWETDHGKDYLLNFMGRTVRRWFILRHIMSSGRLDPKSRSTSWNLRGGWGALLFHIRIQTQTQPAFYNRANTLRNRDLFMRLLESLHTLGYVTEVSTFVPSSQ